MHLKLPSDNSPVEKHNGTTYRAELIAQDFSYIRRMPRANNTFNIVVEAKDKALPVRIVGQTMERDAGRRGFLWYRVQYCADAQVAVDECPDDRRLYGWVREEDLNILEPIDWKNPVDVYNIYGARLDKEADLEATEYVWFKRLDTDADLQLELVQQQSNYRVKSGDWIEKFDIEYGLNLKVKAEDGRRQTSTQLTSFDIERLQQAFDYVEDLMKWGFKLKQDKNAFWSPQEIRYIHEAVASGVEISSLIATQRRIADQDGITLYKAVFGWENNDDTVIRRLPEGQDASIGFAVNRGQGVIQLSDKAFQLNGKTYGLFGLGLKSSDLRFTSTVLIGHEIAHNTNWRDYHFFRRENRRRVVLDKKPRKLDQHYHEKWRSTTWTLQRKHKLLYMSEDGLKNEPLEDEDREVSLKPDSGFTHQARSETREYETVTDALNAHLLGLYTIGPYYSKAENLQGLARKEQGEQLIVAVYNAVTKT